MATFREPPTMVGPIGMQRVWASPAFTLLPKAEMKSPARLFTAMMQDEAPSIGSGLRFMFVKEGRKWVYLLNPFTMRTARLGWTAWEACKPVLVNDDETRARVLASVKRNLKHAEREPTRLEQQALGEEQ